MSNVCEVNIGPLYSICSRNSDEALRIYKLIADVTDTLLIKQESHFLYYSDLYRKYLYKSLKAEFRIPLSDSLPMLSLSFRRIEHFLC